MKNTMTVPPLLPLSLTVLRHQHFSPPSLLHHRCKCQHRAKDKERLSINFNHVDSWEDLGNPQQLSAHTLTRTERKYPKRDAGRLEKVTMINWTPKLRVHWTSVPLILNFFPTLTLKNVLKLCELVSRITLFFFLLSKWRYLWEFSPRKF